MKNRRPVTPLNPLSNHPSLVTIEINRSPNNNRTFPLVVGSPPFNIRGRGLYFGHQAEERPQHKVYIANIGLKPGSAMSNFWVFQDSERSVHGIGWRSLRQARGSKGATDGLGLKGLGFRALGFFGV